MMELEEFKKNVNILNSFPEAMNAMERLVDIYSEEMKEGLVTIGIDEVEKWQSGIITLRNFVDEVREILETEEQEKEDGDE